MNLDQLPKLAKSLALVAAGGAVAALGAWASSHQVDMPTLATVVALAVREADHLLKGE